jgi:hypothetical protein
MDVLPSEVQGTGPVIVETRRDEGFTAAMAVADIMAPMKERRVIVEVFRGRIRIVNLRQQTLLYGLTPASPIFIDAKFSGAFSRTDTKIITDSRASRIGAVSSWRKRPDAEGVMDFY